MDMDVNSGQAQNQCQDDDPSTCTTEPNSGPSIPSANAIASQPFQHSGGAAQVRKGISKFPCLAPNRKDRYPPVNLNRKPKTTSSDKEESRNVIRKPTIEKNLKDSKASEH